MQSRLSWLLTIFLMGFLDIILGVFLVYGLFIEKRERSQHT